MEKLFKHLDLSNNEISKERVKKTVTEWVSKIPGHGIGDLGSKIKVKSIHLLPSHKLDFQTQYENRFVRNAEEPYANQKISELQYTNIYQIDPWTFQLDKILPYQNKSKNYNVTGSHQVHTCNICSGRGHNTCPTWSGNGRETCYTCHGNGLMSCHSCGGSGKSTCSSCGGSGRKPSSICGTCSGSGTIYDYTNQRNTTCGSCGGSGSKGGGTCFNCGGTGQSDCYVCRGTGTLTCTTCGGNGKITCRTCKGKTIVTCYHCKGNKKVVAFFQIKHNLSTKRDVKLQNNKEIDIKYPYLKMDAKDYREEIVFEKTVPNLPNNIFEESNYIESSYKEQIKSSLEEKEKGAKIFQQRIRIYQTDAVDVEYEYEGKNYQLLIYGQYDKIYAPNSPITVVRDTLYHEAKSLYENKKYSESIELLNKAIGMNEDDRVKYLSILKEKALKELKKYYEYGALLGSILGAYIFFTSTLFFLEKPRFIIPSFNADYLKSEWLQSILPLTVGAIFLFLVKNIYKVSSNFLVKYCSAKIKGNVSIILAGAFVSSFFVFLMWLTVMLGNSTGISILFSMIGYYLVQLFQFIISFL